MFAWLYLLAAWLGPVLLAFQMDWRAGVGVLAFYFLGWCLVGGGLVTIGDAVSAVVKRNRPDDDPRHRDGRWHCDGDRCKRSFPSLRAVEQHTAAKHA